METINLKAALTIRVVMHDDWKGEDRIVAFKTKALRGERGGRGTIPDPTDRVYYTIHEIEIDSDTTPWFKVNAIRIEVLWSNVLSVQHES